MITDINRPVRRATRVASHAFVLLLLLSISGCGSSSKTSTTKSATSGGTSIERERTAYLAGLSAYQAGDLASAERDLSTASVSSSPQIAGNSKAMLGQVCLDQHRPRQAATYFADASRLLQGEDARQAAWHAGLAYREAGDEANAKRWLDTASSKQFDGPRTTSVATAAPQSPSNALGTQPSKTSSTPPPLAAATAGKTTVGFTLQVGAFNDKKRAKQAAEDAESLSRRESLGRVRIIPTKDARGQTLYLVHLGWWVTRSEATAARDKVGKLEFIVAPAPAS